MSKKLLILDLDETLVHTEQFPKDFLSEGSYDFKHTSSEEGYEYFTVKRPNVDTFLKYAFENWKVAVWTAAGDKYALNIIKNLGIDVSQLEFFYTRDNCTIKLDYDTCQYYGVKNLSKIRKKYDLDKVLIVDDVHLTAVNNYGNLVPIKPFTTNRKDTELLNLIDYLEKIKDAKKFRNIEKRGWDNN